MAQGYIVDILKYGLELDDQGFHTKARKADDAVNKLASTLKNTLTRALLAAGAAIGAWKLGGLIKDSTLLAARNEVLGTVMNQVGKISGYTAGELEYYDRAVRSMGITTQESRTAIVRMMQSQLDLADAAKLARTAQDLAVISGQNSSEALGTIVEAIAAQRPILLKQFGIVKDLTEVYGDYAKKVGVSAEDLTQLQKKQAFVNVILAEGAKVAGSYEAAMGDVGKQLTSMPRYFEEFKAAIGLAFIPVLEAAVSGLTKFFKTSRDFFLEKYDPMSFIDERLSKVDNVITKYTPHVKSLIDEYVDLTKEGQLSSEKQERLAEVIRELGKIIPAAVIEWDKYGEALKLNTDIAQSFFETYEKIQKTLELKKLAQSVDDLNEYNRKLEETQGKLKEYQEALLEIQEYIDAGQGEDIIGWRRTDAWHGGLIKSGERVNDLWDEYNSKIQKAQYEIKQLNNEIANIVALQKKYQETGTFNFILAPIPDREMSLIEDREKQLASEKLLSEQRFNILRQYGLISDSEWKKILQRRLDETEKFSEEYNKIMVQMFEIDLDMQQKFAEQIQSAIKTAISNIAKAADIVTPDQPGIFDVFKNLGVKIKDAIEESAEESERRIEELKRKQIEMVQAIGYSMADVFSFLDQRLANLIGNTAYGISSILSGGASNIISGGTAILTNVMDALIGSNVSLVQSHRNLEYAIESWENTVKSQTEAETTSDIDRLRAIAGLIEERGVTLTTGGFIRQQLEAMGYDTSGIRDTHLLEYVQELIEVGKDHLNISQDILTAQSQMDFKELLKSGELDYSQATKAIDYWTEIFDLTTEQQLELYETLRDVLMDVQGLTLEQQMSLNETIDRLIESIEESSEEGTSQTYRSVTTITESQANEMLGILNTGNVLKREANSILNSILGKMLDLSGGYLGATSITFSGNTYYFNGQPGDGSGVEKQLSDTLYAQIRAAGGTTL